MELRIVSSRFDQTLSPVPGSFRSEDISPDSLPAASLPPIRAAAARKGSCMILFDESFSLQDALSLVSGPGKGDCTLSAPANCTHALVDLRIEGAPVLYAILSWKGVPAYSTD